MENIQAIFVISVVFSFLAMDHIAVGQVMVSRPIVVGPVVGACLGNVPLGLLAGVVAELMWVQVIPIGRWSIDAAAVTALSVTWSELSSQPGAASWVLSLALAVPAGTAFRQLDIRFRRLIQKFDPWVISELDKGRPSVLGKAVALSVTLWFIKGAAFTMVVAWVGVWGVGAILRWTPPAVVRGLDFAGKLLPLLAFCAVCEFFLKRSQSRWSWFGER